MTAEQRGWGFDSLRSRQGQRLPANRKPRKRAKDFPATLVGVGAKEQSNKRPLPDRAQHETEEGHAVSRDLLQEPLLGSPGLPSAARPGGRAPMSALGSTSLPSPARPGSRAPMSALGSTTVSSPATSVLGSISLPSPARPGSRARRSALGSTSVPSPARPGSRHE